MTRSIESASLNGTLSWRAPAETQFVEAGGVRFAFRVMGSTMATEVPLVFCNRFRGTMDEWDPEFLERLSAHRPLVLFDYEGVSSTGGEVPTTPEALAASTAQFIRALGLERVDLLAFSMGGYVVQILALTEAELVRKCVLCGTGCFGGEGAVPPEDIFFKTATKPSWDWEDKVVLFYADANSARNRGARAEDRIASQLRVGKEPTVPEAAWQNLVAVIQSAASMDNQWYGRMGKIRQPVLVINGDRDPCYPLENQVLLYKQIPNSRLAVLPMAGHAPQHQFPECCASMIEDFLTDEE